MEYTDHGNLHFFVQNAASEVFEAFSGRTEPSWSFWKSEFLSCMDCFWMALEKFCRKGLKHCSLLARKKKEGIWNIPLTCTWNNDWVYIP